MTVFNSKFTFNRPQQPGTVPVGQWIDQQSGTLTEENSDLLYLDTSPKWEGWGSIKGRNCFLGKDTWKFYNDVSSCNNQIQIWESSEHHKALSLARKTTRGWVEIFFSHTPTLEAPDCTMKTWRMVESHWRKHDTYTMSKRLWQKLLTASDYLRLMAAQPVLTFLAMLLPSCNHVTTCDQWAMSGNDLCSFQVIIFKWTSKPSSPSFLLPAGRISGNRVN